jgi:hypothetical protein
VTVDRGLRRVSDGGLSGSCLTHLQSSRNPARLMKIEGHGCLERCTSITKNPSQLS